MTFPMAQIEHLKKIFIKSKGKNELNADYVDKQTFLDNIVEDPYFDDEKLEEVVRESTDGDKETLDALLFRIHTTHKTETIKWDEFINHFCRRGKLRSSEQLVF